MLLLLILSLIKTSIIVRLTYKTHKNTLSNNDAVISGTLYAIFTTLLVILIRNSK